VDIYRLGIVKS